MATIKHIQTPDGVIHDVGGGGGSNTYTLTKSGSTITLTGSGGDVSSVTDANTTYTLSISGDTLTLTPSSGSAQSVTIPDDDTTYTISISGTTITLTPSSGSAQTITIPDATTSSAGAMSAADKTKLDGIASGAEVNVQADWNENNSSSDAYIQNKPTIPTVNDGTLTIQQNGVTVDTFTANQSGNTTVNITTPSVSGGNIWYGTSTTSAHTNAKVATTQSGDFSLATGNIVYIKFTYGQTASSGTLAIDGTTATNITYEGTSTTITDMWRAGEVVGFVYDGVNFVMLDGGTADTSNYGVTKLTNSHTSTSQSLAASASAVKDAYDLADSKVSDVEVNGTSVVSSGVASITVPTVNDATLTIQKNGSTIDTFTANSSTNTTVNVTVPTTTSELTNNSNFVSDASYVHTDNNFTNSDVTKLTGIEAGAEVNVQSDWTQADNTADDYIKNKPSIPTVNDATLTIQKNGTNVETFTANSSTNKTANITVPTATSDLNNDSGFTAVSVNQTLSSGTKIGDITVDGVTTDFYAPSGGSGGVSDVLVDNVSVVTGGVAEIDLTDYVKEDANGDISVSGNATFGGTIYAKNQPGIIKMYAGALPPNGWLFCDGSAVSRTTYAALFAVIGTAYGSGDGSTTFNLPDLRGRVPVGTGTGTASDATSHALGQTSGAETHTLTSGQSGVPAHKHSINHGHGFTNPSSRIYLKKLASSGSATWTPTPQSSSTGNYGDSVVTSGGSVTNHTGDSGNNTAADATTAHNNMQPYTVVNYIISTGDNAVWADSEGYPDYHDLLYFKPGEICTIYCRQGGLCTSGSQQMQFEFMLPKRTDYINSFTINEIFGGIRIVSGGYANNVSDTTSWNGQSGISYGGALYGDRYATVNLVSTTTFKQNGTSTAVTNNTPVTLNGYVTLEFS